MTNGTQDAGAIVEAVAEHYGINVASMQGSSRQRHVCEARHVAAWLLRLLTSLSLEQIGAQLGKHHSSVIYALERIEGESRTDKRLRAQCRTMLLRYAEHLDTSDPDVRAWLSDFGLLQEERKA